MNTDTKNKTKQDKPDFSKTKFAAKSGLAGMGVDIGTDVVTNATAFYKGNKDKVKHINGFKNKLKALSRTPEAKAVGKQLMEQQKGALGLSAAFAAGTTALAYKDDLKKQKQKEGAIMKKASEEVKVQETKKESKSVSKMASIPGTPDWIKAKGGKK